MSEEKTIGLLLQSTPYLNNKKILKVLSPDGILSFISGKAISPSLTTPFAWAEWLYTKDKKEIHALKDGTMLDDLANLKEDYDRLSAAGQIAKDLLRTQQPGKPAHEAVTLALACLRKLHLFTAPQVLVATFRLKLLCCEGLLDPDEATDFQELLLAKSFIYLASLPKNEAALSRIDQLFQQRVDF